MEQLVGYSVMTGVDILMLVLMMMSVSAADNRLVWCGVAMGVVVSILLIVLDEALATQPMLKVVHLTCSNDQCTVHTFWTVCEY